MIFCARCGAENPDDGKFCRNCGGRIGLIGEPGSGGKNEEGSAGGRSRRERYASGSRKFIWGLIFLVAGVFLGVPLKGNEYWVFTLLPGMSLIVWSMADFIRVETGWNSSRGSASQNLEKGDRPRQALPPEKTTYAEQEAGRRYDTGEMVPPSVTEGTTRDLKADQELKTRKLEDN